MSDIADRAFAKKHAKGPLTYTQRKRLRSSSFAEPGERKYPINDINHARNALARVAQFGSPSEQARVRAMVHRNYPQLKQKD
jgi:hypothetical protein